MNSDSSSPGSNAVIGRDSHGKQAWNTYWNSAPINACTEQFPPAARNDIAQRWQAVFAALPKGASVLDIATGKGAVLFHALASGHPPGGLDLLGVDQADIPTPKSPHPSLVFQGGVEATALPFADRRFDLVTSQFGIEYADFQKAIVEASRVTSGQLLCLIHASDGIVVRQNAAQADQIRWLLNDIHLIDHLRRFVSAQTPAYQQDLEQALNSLQARAEQEENPSMIQQVMGETRQLQTLAHRYNPADLLKSLNMMEQRMAAHASRMTTLARAGRTESEVMAARSAFWPRVFIRLQ
ncbi:hypothetical protein JCM17845_28420 [Iodidimonas gelatinilytica]|uniref:Methyltransferase type 11 domain-containing protein n=1 Tax=Iodidimonas gelatinilytica TaxID=1236966 RepID=A0A5A7N589_9PROT|nr:methyltransferase domain-containing protein [Iodidimonas gelatinilytica]GER02219.1 hypothetical protein JCM17845_28420 [Iodidimonas gelatinilytica]